LIRSVMGRISHLGSAARGRVPAMFLIRRSAADVLYILVSCVFLNFEFVCICHQIL